MADDQHFDGPERRHPRVTIDAFVRVLGGAREYVLRTRDLSQGGLFLYTRVGHLFPFQVGSALAVELYDFDSVVRLRAEVVRVVEPGSEEASGYPSGFGLRIIAIDEDNGARLARLIRRAQDGQLPY